MKTRINKSEVMKRAWKIFRGKNPYSYSFQQPCVAHGLLKKKMPGLRLKESNAPPQ